MGAKWQRVTIPIPSSYGPQTRLAIAQDIIDRIVKRTRKENVDKDGVLFPEYSKAYISSAAFRDAGKSKNRINLTLSKEMLDALDVISTKRGGITIGYEKGTDVNAKADGNIRGTYGRPRPIPGKARDFLGLTEDEKQEILDSYPEDEG